jgi:phosphotransacetylase
MKIEHDVDPPASGVTVGPTLLVLTNTVHVLTPTVSVCHIVNMAALAEVKTASSLVELKPAA